MTPEAPLRLEVADRDLPASRFECVGLAAARFKDVNLSNATFEDVDLSASIFTDVALRHARFTNIDLGDVDVSQSRLAGMRIDGILVTDLLEAYRAKQG